MMHWVNVHWEDIKVGDLVRFKIDLWADEWSPIRVVKIANDMLHYAEDGMPYQGYCIRVPEFKYRQRYFDCERQEEV